VPNAIAGSSGQLVDPNNPNDPVVPITGGMPGTGGMQLPRFPGFNGGQR
jgi:hypothetical protein